MKKINIFIAAFVAALAAVSAASAENIKVDFDGKKSVEDIRIAYPADLNNLRMTAAELKARFSAEGIAVPAVNKGYVVGPPANPVEWVSISGGKFMMGTDEFLTGLGTAKPVHEVTINTFEMSKTPVTVEQYAECVLKGACVVPSSGDNCNWGVPGRQNHPINCMGWHQANQFFRFR